MTISLWLMILYFWGMTVLVLSILRYMVPAMGLLFVLIPGSFSQLGKLSKQGEDSDA